MRLLRHAPKRRFFTAAVVLVAAVLAGQLPAQAASNTSSVNVASDLYDCTGDFGACKVKVGSAASGTKLTMLCWEDGRAAQGGGVRWFYVRLSNNVEGFMSAKRVSHQTTVKACWDKNASATIDGILAANWALNHLASTSASTTPTKTENERLAKITGVSKTWMAGDWSGDCIGFAVLAHDSAGTKVPMKNARQVYDHYKAAKKINTSTKPPRGALVFWNATSKGTNYGHVEISLGNGRSVGTQGWDGQNKPITAEKIGSANYLGWAMP